jgi:hypothetical protein
MSSIGNFSPVPPSSSDPNKASVKESQSAKSIESELDSSVQKKDSGSENTVRGLEKQDLRQRLLQMTKPPTLENMQKIMTLLKHGIPASEQAFSMIEQFTKGKEKGNKLEASAVAIGRGLEGNSKAVDLISNFLSQNVQLSKVMDGFAMQLAKFRSSFGNFNNLLDPALISGIAGFLDDFLDEMGKLKKHSKDLDLKSLFSKQSGLIQDLKYLQEFLRGVNSQVNVEDILSKEFNKMVNKTITDSKELHNALLTQLVLSKTPENMQLAKEFYNYWMVPNPMANALNDIELMISKDTVNKKKINPDNTTIVIKCETNELGMLTIIIELKGKKMAYKVYSEKVLTQKFVLDYSPDLKTSMEKLSYEVTSVRSLKKFVDIGKLLIPTFDLNNMKRINTEV